MPTRRIITAPTVGLRHTIAFMGDSMSDNYTLGIEQQHFPPEVLAAALRGLGASVKARDFGRSGNTTTQMLARIGEMTLYDVPDIAVIWGGVNDPANSISSTTSQTNIQSMITSLKNAGVTRILIVNTQYLNYSTGGDTLATPYATYATLRPYILASATTFAADPVVKVAHVDLYAYMKSIIVNGYNVLVVANGSSYQVPANAQATPAAVDAASFNWHVADANQHLNVLGHQIVANAIQAAIQSQPGWLAALSS